jgi:nucleoside 2-deoxyribosyltransferase
MKLYLAGPDVFRPDARQWAAQARTLCRREGHDALIPMDGRQMMAAGIYRHNLALIGEADPIVANLNPFRGAEPDSGTCVEIGYALALGKPGIAYAESLVPMSKRLHATDPDVDGVCRAAHGWTVENFGLPLNLMLSVPVVLEQGGLEAALRIVRTRTAVPVAVVSVPLDVAD